MRQRITFFHDNEDAIEPDALKVVGRSLSGPDIKAVREDRITLGLEELPTELQELLRATYELHIRWSPPSAHRTIGPWASRLPPGLHVFFTPQQDDAADTLPNHQLCSLLRQLGSPDCSTPQESFTKLPNDRFSHATAYQYYSPQERVTPFIEYAAQYACASADSDCNSHVRSLASAKLVDFSFDTISHVVKITTMGEHKHQSLSMTSKPDQRVEVGLLTPDAPEYLDEHELGVTGLLTVLSDGKKPSPTLFQFPSRHKRVNASFSSKFLQPMGMHPTMQLQVQLSKPPMESSYCSLHAYLTLPRTIFADRYQLEDSLFLTSKNLTGLKYMSQPVDLEAPDYVMQVWGSSVLLELRAPAEEESGRFSAEVPLHLRYKSPKHGGSSSFKVPYPVVFWACAAEEGTKFPNNPFDRVNLGYDGLFGPRTIFWHLDPVPEPGSQQLMLDVNVPVLDLNQARPIQVITAFVVLSGFAWVVWKLLMVYLKSGFGVQQPVGERETEKKKQ